MAVSNRSATPTPQYRKVSQAIHPSVHSVPAGSASVPSVLSTVSNSINSAVSNSGL